MVDRDIHRCGIVKSVGQSALLQFGSAIGAVHALDLELTMAKSLLDSDPLLTGAPFHLGQGDQAGIIVQTEAGQTSILIHVGFVNALVLAQSLLQTLHAAVTLAVIGKSKRVSTLSFWIISRPFM